MKIRAEISKIISEDLKSYIIKLINEDTFLVKVKIINLTSMATNNL